MADLDEEAYKLLDELHKCERALGGAAIIFSSVGKYEYMVDKFVRHHLQGNEPGGQARKEMLVMELLRRTHMSKAKE